MSAYLTIFFLKDVSYFNDVLENTASTKNNSQPAENTFQLLHLKEEPKRSDDLEYEGN